MIPLGRRLFYAGELAATPSLFEPIFICEISCPSEVLGGVYQVLHKRRSSII
jgi:elongation factor 2